MKSDLHWWLHNVSVQCRKIFRVASDIHLFTDASITGWDDQLHHMTAGGSWSSEEKLLHNNALELKAILFALQAFTLEVCGKHIKVFCDNTGDPRNSTGLGRVFIGRIGVYSNRKAIFPIRYLRIKGDRDQPPA
ncbi:hypothetical protein E2C01_085434 [Portunus trituberculatus]|uniref:RNase H type-1 domain-containing protein n=1 Tax=Portunus trituberculatus TaxID=210409 RepID=A0A5B7J8V5_PORTR|nr:hypothetical protein [Portunus trituberculatus]